MFKYQQATNNRLYPQLFPFSNFDSIGRAGYNSKRIAISNTSSPSYSWDTNFISNINSSPVLDTIGTLGTDTSATVLGQSNKSVYRFANKSGLILNNPVVPVNNYSIELVFSLDLTTGYRKLIDFSDRTSDTGLYVLNNSLRFYGTNFGGGTLATGYNHLVLTRASNNATTVFLNGTQVISFNDSTGLADLSPGGDLALFIDDTVTGGNEQSAGAVDFIGLYGGVLSGAEVSARSTFFRNNNSEITRVSLSLNPTGMSENSPGNFTYTLTRTGFSANALTVNFSVSGTATFGSDYTVMSPNTAFNATTGSVTFAPNVTTTTLIIDPVADTTVEGSETISITLAPSNNYARETTTAVLATIINDDNTRNQRGSSGDDVLLGTNRADILNGDFGSDTLTGGANPDTFAFSSPNQGIDTITDFVVADDTILVSASSFTGAGLVAGNTLSPSQFVIGATATNANQRFVYDSATGFLRFDRDGSGVAAAIDFAKLSQGLSLTNENILVG